jgi:VanZ family protein
MSTSPPSTHSHAPARWPWYLAIAVYYVATCLGHLQFSLWLVRGRTIEIGGQTHVYAFAYAVPWVAALGVAALAWVLWRQVQRCTRPGPGLVYWGLWLLAVALVDRYLTYSANEYAHYPQYALLAWLLGRVFDPDRRQRVVARVLFWTTLLGALDEFLQYVWITRSYSNYLDFNDFLVNLLAAAVGVMLYYGLTPRAPSARGRRPRLEWAVASLIAVCVATGMASGRVVVTPEHAAPHSAVIHYDKGRPQFWLQQGPEHYGGHFPGKRHPTFFVLPPGAGLLLMGLVFAVFSTFPNGASSPMRK